MTFNELQKTWQEDASVSKLTIDSDLLLREVKRNKESFESTIFWRDVREAVAGLGVSAFFLYFWIRHGVWELLLLAFLVTGVIVFLLGDRIIQRRKKPKMAETLSGCVGSSLTQVNHQIWLLKNVFWWYLLPPAIGIVIFVGRVAWAARSDRRVLIFLFTYSVFCLLLYVGIYLLNQYAVRKELNPRRQELEQLLKGLKNDDIRETPNQKRDVKKMRSLLILLALFVLIGATSIWLITKNGSNDSSNQPAPVSQDLIPQKGLYIIDARYGVGTKWINVSNQIRREIRDNALSIKASNDIAGDPHFGVAKSLKVEYVLDGQHKTVEVQEGEWLHIPPDVTRHPELKPAGTEDELMMLVKNCPAELGFYGRNLSTGQTVEYRPDQPACLASIVKIFVLLEIMRQADRNILDLSESITIVREGKKEVCTISQAIDKMIGISDNEATGALASRVGYDSVNALPAELGIAGLSNKILPEPGVLDKVLDKRVYASQPLATELLPQHGTARGIVRYFELLSEKKLISESISARVLEVFDRNPKRFAPTATPADFKSGGKGGSIGWFRPNAKPYTMVGWGALIENQDTALVFCLWFEWFPESTSEELKRQWCYTVSDSIVNILLAQQPAVTKKGD